MSFRDIVMGFQAMSSPGALMHLDAPVTHMTLMHLDAPVAMQVEIWQMSCGCITVASGL